MSETLAPAVSSLGLWAGAMVALPLIAGALAFILGGRAGPWIGNLAAPLLVVCASLLVRAVARHGTLSHAIGGWEAPLGILWRLDGPAVALLLATAVIGWAVALFAAGRLPRQELERTPDRFWPPFLMLWAGLNALFLSADIFNLYVTLEIVSLAAVVLVTLEGVAAALRAAMRYLLIAQAGSLSYLLGVGLLYGFGTLDLAQLGARVEPTPAALAAMALMTGGLFAKSAVFPLHVWLPPAHSSAPSPASALLSGLVVMASLIVLLRLWLEVFLAVAGPVIPHLLGALGATAVVWGSFLALRQARLKLLLAYSTTAQIGYLLLIVPLAGTPGGWSGGLYLAVSHALAKASMFLATGLVLEAAGHDRLSAIRGAARYMPMTVFTLGLGGLTLIGLPPSGGFIGKWLLLSAAFASGQWWWALALLAGSLLAAGSIFKILAYAFEKPGEAMLEPVPRWLEVVPLGLVVTSVLLGFLGRPIGTLLKAGAP